MWLRVVTSGDKGFGGLRVATGGYKWLWLVLGGFMWLRVDASGYGVSDPSMIQFDYLWSYFL